MLKYNLIGGKQWKNASLLFWCWFFHALHSFFAQGAMEIEKTPVKVLILPKFEIGDLSGDFPGEAQYYYEAYVKDGEEYDIKGSFENNKLYVKDGVALYLTGMGKVNSAISLQAVLSDNRFDFSDCYFLSTGSAESSREYTVMGDVFGICMLRKTHTLACGMKAAFFTLKIN